MHLTLTRFKSDENTTLGELTHNGVHIAWTLEDEFREEKVAGETRIPAGIYNIIPRTYGRFFEAYKERWGYDFGFEIENVPGFTHILIHTGNHEGHTDGCILVGTFVDTSAMTVGNSRGAYVALMDYIGEYVESDDCTIEIIDNDL